MKSSEASFDGRETPRVYLLYLPSTDDGDTRQRRRVTSHWHAMHAEARARATVPVRPRLARLLLSGCGCGRGVRWRGLGGGSPSCQLRASAAGMPTPRLRLRLQGPLLADRRANNKPEPDVPPSLSVSWRGRSPSFRSFSVCNAMPEISRCGSGWRTLLIFLVVKPASQPDRERERERERGSTMASLCSWRP